MSADRIGLVESLRLLHQDYRGFLRIYNRSSGVGSFLSACLYPGLIAMAFHRLGHYLYVRKLTLVSDALYLVCFILTGVEIAPSAQIGGGFVLFHTSAMAVSGRIGRNVVLSSRTVMGTDGSTVDVGGGPGLPVLGDNVYVGANSLILGPRRIGSNVVIYANSVITRDVPDGGRMFGIPARLINAARLSRGRVATRATFVPLAGTTAAPVEDPKE